jgi:Mlc titration factor MtfA (ptsG expression regulator)
MFGKIREWRRSRVLARVQLDERAWRSAVQRFEFARGLDAQELARLKELVILFLHEKRFSTAHGLVLTEDMRLNVAIQACVVILNLGMDYYRGWSEVLLYPAQFVPRHQYTDEMGIVHQGDQPYSGEAWLNGPVILSWEDVARSEEPDGVNVVIHEFAHKLDMLNGAANGFPPLHREMNRHAWVQTFTAAYHDFCARVDAGEDPIIDPYASETPGEFFAVFSEAFFELPDIVQDEYPAVYEQLAQFYRQNPLARLAKRRGSRLVRMH